MLRAFVAAVIVATLVACAQAPAPAMSPAAAPIRDCNLAQSERFVLHNDPWINLHHFLFEWARNIPEQPAGDRRRRVEVPEHTDFARLDESEKQAWQRAIRYYRESLVPSDLTFARDLIAMRSELGAIACAAETRAISNNALWAVLQDAMPVYRRHWWPAHHASNAEWTRKMMEQLRAHETALTSRLAAVYGGEWPAERIRLDVSAYASWPGAYTTNRPNQLTVSSVSYKDLEALELVLHEVGHATFFEQRLFGHIEGAFSRYGQRAPDLLAHLIQFITPAEILRERLRADELARFESVGERVISGGRMQPLQPIVTKHWKAFLAGEIDRDTALDRIARELAEKKTE